MKQAEDGGEDMIKDMGEDVIMDVAEDTGTRGLIWAACGNCPCDNEESVEGDPERSDTNDNTCNSHVNLPKVERQRATEQQERNLQHQWQ